VPNLVNKNDQNGNFCSGFGLKLWKKSGNAVQCHVAATEMKALRKKTNDT